MRKIIESDFLEDNSKLNEYINEIINDIDKNDEMESTVKNLLSNILDIYKNFKDPRYLKSNNIEAIISLINTINDMPLKKAQAKKNMLETLIKKYNFDKKISVESKLNDTMVSMKSILEKLDEMGINPKTSKKEG